MGVLALTRADPCQWHPNQDCFLYHPPTALHLCHEMEFLMPVTEHHGHVMEFFMPVTEHHRHVIEVFMPVMEHHGHVMEFLMPVMEHHMAVMEHLMPVMEQSAAQRLPGRGVGRAFRAGCARECQDLFGGCGTELWNLGDFFRF